jgi:hypothetical protein
VFGILHLAYGLFVGFIYGIFGLLMAAGGGNQAGIGLAIAGGSILILPIFVGMIGFIAGILAALVHNIGVGFVGGLILEVEDDSEDDED